MNDSKDSFNATGSSKEPSENKDAQSFTPWGVFKSLNLWEELQVERFGRIPCARQALLTGIGSGLTVFTVRWLTRRHQMGSAVNWGMGLGILASLTTWEWCRYQLAVIRTQLDQMALSSSSSSSVSTSSQSSSPINSS